MAEATTTTRRALIAAGAGLAAAAGTVAATASTIPATEAQILQLVAETARLRAAYNMGGDMKVLRQFDEHEKMVLRAPCVSNRVAAAQLRIGALQSMEEGDRADRLDIRNLERVIAFLAAH